MPAEQHLAKPKAALAVPSAVLNADLTTDADKPAMPVKTRRLSWAGGAPPQAGSDEQSGNSPGDEPPAKRAKTGTGGAVSLKAAFHGAFRRSNSRGRATPRQQQQTLAKATTSEAMQPKGAEKISENDPLSASVRKLRLHPSNASDMADADAAQSTTVAGGNTSTTKVAGASQPASALKDVTPSRVLRFRSPARGAATSSQVTPTPASGQIGSAAIQKSAFLQRMKRIAEEKDQKVLEEEEKAEAKRQRAIELERTTREHAKLAAELSVPLGQMSSGAKPGGSLRANALAALAARSASGQKPGTGSFGAKTPGAKTPGGLASAVRAARAAAAQKSGVKEAGFAATLSISTTVPGKTGLSFARSGSRGRSGKKKGSKTSISDQRSADLDGIAASLGLPTSKSSIFSRANSKDSASAPDGAGAGGTKAVSPPGAKKTSIFSRTGSKTSQTSKSPAQSQQKQQLGEPATKNIFARSGHKGRAGSVSSSPKIQASSSSAAAAPAPPAAKVDLKKMISDAAASSSRATVAQHTAMVHKALAMTQPHAAGFQPASRSENPESAETGGLL